jgi:hypothetical protein
VYFFRLELSEGQSNQAETSTAARHGTMIIPVQSGPKRGGTQMEYLSDFTRGKFIFIGILCVH